MFKLREEGFGGPKTEYENREDAVRNMADDEFYLFSRPGAHYAVIVRKHKGKNTIYSWDLKRNIVIYSREIRGDINIEESDLNGSGKKFLYVIRSLIYATVKPFREDVLILDAYYPEFAGGKWHTRSSLDLKTSKYDVIFPVGGSVWRKINTPDTYMYIREKEYYRLMREDLIENLRHYAYECNIKFSRTATKEELVKPVAECRYKNRSKRANISKLPTRINRNTVTVEDGYLIYGRQRKNLYDFASDYVKKEPFSKDYDYDSDEIDIGEIGNGGGFSSGGFAQ